MSRADEQFREYLAYADAHKSRKQVRREEAEERQESYEKAIRAEAGRINLDEDMPEDDLFAQAKRNIDATRKTAYDAQKERN